MKVAVVATFDSKNIKSWSGIPIQIIKIFESIYQTKVDAIVIAKKRTFKSYLLSFYFNRVKCKKYYNWIDDYNNFNIKYKIRKLIKGYDIIITFQFYLVSALKQKNNKIIFWSDATFENLINYYDYLKNIPKYLVNRGNKIQRKALHNSDLIVLTSKWAADSAIGVYRIPESKVNILPLGANLINVPDQKDIDCWNQKRVGYNKCNFLFIGIDWERKGGSFALNVIVELNNLGTESYMFVVGCEPNVPDHLRKYVKVLGFLNKQNPEESIQLEQVLIESNVFIMPSIAECFGCVFCEANAFGLPVIGRNTGGVPDIIKNGINGFLIEPEHTPAHVAELWNKIWQNKALYRKMCKDARIEFSSRLNWSYVQNRLENLLKL